MREGGELLQELSDIMYLEIGPVKLQEIRREVSSIVI